MPSLSKRTSRYYASTSLPSSPKGSRDIETLKELLNQHKYLSKNNLPICKANDLSIPGEVL